MMLGYARMRGLRRLMIPVPVLTPRLSSYWVSLVSPVPASIARPLIEGLRNEVVVRDPEPARRLGIDPCSYADDLRLAIERTDRQAGESTWFDALTAPDKDGVSSMTSREVEFDHDLGQRHPVGRKVGTVHGKTGYMQVLSWVGLQGMEFALIARLPLERLHV